MGLLFKAISMYMDNKRHMHAALTGQLEAERDERKSIRASVSKGFAWTRRIIALSVVGAYVGPKIWALAYGDPRMPMAYCYYQTKGLLFNLFSKSPALACQELPIISVTPLDSHLLFAVVGLYFGAQERRR